jgi:EAL domain-containing protein (putative c-di-GMP-specific phosphodiesterase class I)
MRILLIDDDPFTLKLLGRQLSNLGHMVVAHEQAGEALPRLERNEEVFDAVMCDLRMPEMDGIEFVRHLARIGFTGGLVLVSGEDARILQTSERLAREHGLYVLGALRKPVAPDALQRVMDQQRPRHARPRASASAPLTTAELDRAIAEDRLECHYQPKVSVNSGAVTGVETLARLRQADGTLIYPDRFITTAEEHGLINTLTRAVFAAALPQARLWRDAGLDLHVAVNVSMDDLDDLAFPEYVVREAERAGVPLTSLVLEVTESRLSKNPLLPLDILSRLRLKQVGLSIDDFGTGYSTMTQLRDLPFNELKVDRGFVHSACRDASLCAIFEASLGMARQLGMRSVSEGVEDAADWLFLRASGCDLAQGYYIARPMPAAEVANWVELWAARLPELMGSGT